MNEYTFEEMIHLPCSMIHQIARDYLHIVWSENEFFMANALIAMGDD